MTNVAVLGSASADGVEVKARATAVYERLLGAVVMDARAPPTLELWGPEMPPSRSGARLARFERDRHRIVLEQSGAEALLQRREHADDALALVLGHELAHFARSHGWEADIAEDYRRLSAEQVLHTDVPISAGIRSVLERVRGFDLATVLKPERWASAGGSVQDAKALEILLRETERKAELEADYYGGLYAYLAGYDAFGAAGSLADALWDKRSPEGKERIRWLQSSSSRAQQLVPVYEAAKVLLLVGKLAQAAFLFDEVSSRLPAREAFLNAGVAYACEAIRRGGAKMAYPMEMVVSGVLDIDHTTPKLRGPTQDVLPLLELARERFTRLDAGHSGGDATALVNLAVVYDLLGDHELAAAIASKAHRLSAGRPTSSHAAIVRAIALSQTGDAETAQLTENISRSGARRDVLVDAELGALTGSEGFAPKCSNGQRPKVAKFHFHPSGRTPGTPIEQRVPLDRSREATLRWTQTSSTWAIEIALAGEVVVARGTRPQFTDALTGDVRIGSSVETLDRALGCPSRIFFTDRGEIREFLRGPNPIAFVEISTIGARETVSGWTVVTRPRDP